MKRTSNSPSPMEIFGKVGLIAALAAVLLMPTTVKVASDELAPRVEHTWPMLKRASWNSLPLPPIPHLATMPWLEREPSAKRMKIDTLLAPKFEFLGPAVANTTVDDSLSSIVRRPAPTSALEASRHG